MAATLTMGLPAKVTMNATSPKATKITCPGDANLVVIYVDDAAAVGRISNAGTDGTDLDANAYEPVPNKSRYELWLSTAAHGSPPVFYIASDVNSAVVRMTAYRVVSPSVP